ncbi:MAG: tRNA (adenosine(37)-N6)-threonylcarbamoyltransferase complex ATPase subunit type 1 TsaE [Planctomycetota bacterium]
MHCEFVSDSPETTRKLGCRLGAAISAPGIILLEGDLGAGKTLLTKGIYEGFGGNDVDSVVSPSYTLVHHHDAGGRSFYHVDLYRLENPDHVLGLEYEDFLYLQTGLTVVEWPRSLRELMAPEDYLDVRIRPGESQTDRIIEIKISGDRYLKAFSCVEVA